MMLFQKWRPLLRSAGARRSFRSDSALLSLAKASEARSPNVVVLYNYPSFSGAFSALFAHLYYSRLNIPCLILPFSSVIPFRVEDVCIDGLKECYFLDFVGPKGFLSELSKRTSAKIIGFDHRKLALKNIPPKGHLGENVSIQVNLEKSSSFAVYEYFSSKLSGVLSDNEGTNSLLEAKDQVGVEMVLKYIEDGDLRKWSLPDIRAFNVGIRSWRSKLNCITNPHMYQQLLDMSYMDIIAEGKSFFSTREIAANKMLDKVILIRLGRGIYGKCLGVKLQGKSDVIDEVGNELSRRSAAAGLRPIGAVIHMQRKNLKMCLRSTDVATDTSEVAKAYGGGGCPSSSSFIIRMDEYNKWISSAVS
ncbi:OLC1v1002771C1 [Oldenlandia corymbosa var. corymbosa]|uniref:OLC1v1002771C1 n=1 Tax=Oldenlandia corymbosa var. corymbosa TaxID=529605 RepID=A0AAV1D980_OLDCO|nr:OLC1v1002771C1 [Oldenlandia corymbosa var. corymbosa]